jgi:hypothetical protein
LAVVDLMEIQHIQANGTHPRPAAQPKAVEPKFSLLRADGEAVKLLWSSFIRPGLEAIKYPRKIKSQRTGHIWERPPADPRSGTWLPEHVRALIDRGHMGLIFCECHLIIPVSGTKPVGFVVLRLYPDEFVQVPLTLFVWIAYCKDPRALRYVLPLVEKRAREIGVRYVEGVTSLTAWARRLRPYGYQVHQIIIRKEIT